MTLTGLAPALERTLRPGVTVAMGDGVGALRMLEDGSCAAAVLSAAARGAAPVRLVLGWLPSYPQGIELDAFDDIVALMPGWGMRDVLRSPTAQFVPTSVAAMPKLLRGLLRPDLLITRLVRRDGALHFSTEVSWQREIMDAGVPTLAIIDRSAPTADAGKPLDDSRVEVVAETEDGPALVPSKPPEPIHEALADAVLKLVPAGARLQYGPGPLGTALLRRATTPLRIDTGLLTDAVVDLDNHGLLADTPSATYLLGSDRLYDWADGRPILRGIDYSHDLTRLSRGGPFVAVNTAIEIDPFGQVNVEGAGEKVVGGIGGHPDYCMAARMSRGGLSIIAVPSKVNGRSVLVERLSRPASTPAHDIDLIVTEEGYADLRAADWPQRRKLITELFSS